MSSSPKDFSKVDRFVTFLLGAKPSFTVKPIEGLSVLSSKASSKPSPSVSFPASTFCGSPFSAISRIPSLSESASK